MAERYREIGHTKSGIRAAVTTVLAGEYSRHLGTGVTNFHTALIVEKFMSDSEFLLCPKYPKLILD